MPKTAAVISSIVFFFLAVGSASASQSAATTRLPCVEFDTDLGEFGAYVFELLHKPTACTEYVGNRPCHCTEAPLTGIRWRRWGALTSPANATWHYCGMGTCVYRPAKLIASRLRDRCGAPVYTRLSMNLPRKRLRHGRVLPAYHALFRLPACGGPFDYI